MSPPELEQAFDLAVQHHQSGRLPEAEQIYRQILKEHPDHAAAMHLLGVIAGSAGRNDIAIDLIVRAIRLVPNFSVAFNNLGNALRDSGRLEEAIAAYHQAVLLNPNLAEAHNNLGNALKENGQAEQAIAACRKAIALNPMLATAYNNLANALHDKGDLDEAITACRQAIALNPEFAQAFNNLGCILHTRGEIDESLAAFRKAITLRPDLAPAFSNLGNALRDKQQFNEAADACRKAIALQPDYAEAFSNLSHILLDQSKIDQSIEACRKAIALKPDHVEALFNLANALQKSGQLDEAIENYRKAIKLKPIYAAAHSNLIYAMLCRPEYDARAIGDECRRWNDHHAAPLKKFIQPHTNDRSPDRRLKIGYVSPDFREHVVGRNLLPLLENHDHRQFEIICYSGVRTPDAMTRLFQAQADGWRDIDRVPDDRVAAQIRDDQIDILVDLSLHTSGNRLLVFARKPAPIQISYLGLGGTTGLDAIDYRFSDPHIDPPNSNLTCYSETTIRLPNTYWCYQPNHANTPDPAPVPAVKNGCITFGCLNNPAKVSPAAHDLWSKVLSAIPHSKLILHSLPGQHQIDISNRLHRNGVSRDRLQFVGFKPWADFALTYSQIDIALDPFPYNGGITTCDALWLGVPVITLSGQTSVARFGRSILTNLGLTDWIAHTQEEYVQIAKHKSADIPSLVRLRGALREIMQRSPLMNAPQFARDVEAAYRNMWRSLCGTNAS